MAFSVCTAVPHYPRMADLEKQMGKNENISVGPIMRKTSVIGSIFNKSTADLHQSLSEWYLHIYSQRQLNRKYL